MNFKQHLPAVFATLAAMLMAILWVFPLLWAALTSLKPESQTVAQPIVWIPTPPTLQAYLEVITLGNLPRWYVNSTLVTLIVTVLTVVLSTGAAYAFSQLRFPGRNALFVFALLGFYLPFEVMLIPLFKQMFALGLFNSLPAIILPQLVAPATIYVFKGFFDQIPREYREAATLDGANEFTLLTRVYVPLAGNILWAMAIVTFIGAWNNFLWPFIITNSAELFTVPLGLTQVQDSYGVRNARLMAAAMLGALPMMVLYLVFQKRVMQGFLTAAGIKG